MQTLVTMTAKEFDQQYAAVAVYLQFSAFRTEWRESDCFKSRIEELKFIHRFARQRLWTIIDEEDGETCLQSGVHFVKRLGFVASRNPIAPGDSLVVRVTREFSESPPTSPDRVELSVIDRLAWRRRFPK